MKGSKKQIEWAEKIKEKYENEISEMKLRGQNPIMDKAIDTIMAIDYAEFWIDAKDSGIQLVLKKLSTGKLRYKGLGFADQMGMSQSGEVNYSKMDI